MKSGNSLLFELSGEHPELPYAELEAVLAALMSSTGNQAYKISRVSNRLIVVNFDEYSKSIGDALNLRLGMCRSIHELLTRMDSDNIDQRLEELNLSTIPKNSTFKLITRHLEKEKSALIKDKTVIKNKIIRKMSKHVRVDVRNPEFEIILYLANDLFLTKKLFDLPRSDFEHRKPQLRPFFAPVSLHPRLARCLINLAGLRKDEILLDPFCGTGGILIEAGLMGIRVIGSDIDRRMVEGTKINLEHENIKNFLIISQDVSRLSEYFSSLVQTQASGLVDDTNVVAQAIPQPHAIVTEPPYGRASTTQGEDLNSLLENGFKVFSEILQPNGRVVISLPNPELVEYAFGKFKLCKSFEFRVHKSLTKSIFVLKLKNNY
jgi:tRNA (guanine10-N2)-dimethyltransferase